MRKLLIAGVSALALSACSLAQMAQVQNDQSAVRAAITTACGDVNAAAALAAPFSPIPQVGAILDYATASCATADAVSAMVTKAVNDPTTVSWVQKLATDIKAAIPARAF